MMKILLFHLLSPTLVLAFTNGGADNINEFARIQKSAPQMKRICDMDAYIKNIRTDQVEKIARNLLYNETSCQGGYLTEWDKISQEEFPSIGLPHTVWFPGKSKQIVDESFPRFWAFIKAKYRGTMRIPDLGPVGTEGLDVRAPWNSIKEFKSDPRVAELNRFLQDPNVLKLQAEFAVRRGMESIYSILATNAMDPNKKMSQEDLCQNFKDLISSDQGLLAMVDYANWKGEGIHWHEMTDNRRVRWGLKQALEKMGKPSSAAVVERFAAATSAALKERSSDDPIILNKLAALNSRIDRTYRKGGVSPAQCPIWPSGVRPTTASQGMRF